MAKGKQCGRFLAGRGGSAIADGNFNIFLIDGVSNLKLL